MYDGDFYLSPAPPGLPAISLVFVQSRSGNTATDDPAASRRRPARPEALGRLRQAGIRRVSAVGGRTTATSLVDAGMVQDLLLTTTSREAGESGTPWYLGRRPPMLTTITAKHGRGDDGEIRVEHLAVSGTVRP